MRNNLNNLKIFAFTHRNLDVAKIGLLHIEDDAQKHKISIVKTKFNIDEIMFLSTCNRVEITIVSQEPVGVAKFLDVLYPELNPKELSNLANNVEEYTAKDAVDHALSVASSIDSMIVGEREIITQVRNAFERSHKNQLTGDFIRLLTKQVIQTAKKVYTETSIATKPVSVVSLAYHKLKALNIPLDSKILIIGSGVTNSNMCKFLKKHGFTNFVVFNRTLSNAASLAKELNAPFHALSDLANYNNGFDVLLTCTGADHSVVSLDMYEFLLRGDTDKKTLIDIAIPQDISPEVIAKHNLNYLSIDLLQKISNDNLKVRVNEVEHVKVIVNNSLKNFVSLIQERNVELAMLDVPRQVKAIKENALDEVFKRDMEDLGPEAREVLDKVLGYVEKKYISGPMKLAKEIILKNASN
ncbi:MAG: glutamyl-tRNA reductase [Crocinitomicaceae bacterium]|tara:strand:- start:18588 stop:19823 length:1236 start_codon:yes stop_codon:yes gene_type:complete